MANAEQLSILKQGVEAWNRWQATNARAKISLRFEQKAESDLGRSASFNAIMEGADLSGADLKGFDLANVELAKANLQQADLRGADLTRAKLERANLVGANLSHAKLAGANLAYADLNGGNLSEANLKDASLIEANLNRSDFSHASLRGAQLGYASIMFANFGRANLFEAGLRAVHFWGTNLKDANLRDANLTESKFFQTDLTGADIRNAILVRASFVESIIDNAKVSGSSVHGISVWDLEGEFREQEDLVITPEDAPKITVDNIEIAQFVYLILKNEKIRSVINTLTSKSVLILGRFSIPERKAILDALRNKLREYNLLPIVFDFDRPTDKDFTETIKTLAGLCYFVIADITNPKSSPLELQATVPDYQIPFVPIIQEGEQPFAMMIDLQKKYNWVLPTKRYDSIDTLMQALKPGIIDPAVEMRNKLRLIKAQEQTTESLKDYLDKTL